MNNYMKVFKNYANFSGRTGKREFWTFLLVNFGISILLSIVGQILNFTLLGTLFSLLILIPTIAVWVRRMRDIGKEWWFMLIPFYNLYLALQDSQPVANEIKTL